VAEPPAGPLLNIGVVGLGVMGQRLLERIDAHPRLQATQAWDADAQALQQAFGAGAQGLGRLQQVEIELGFAAWLRPWQAAAGAWLSQRADGGFVREVLSRFIFVLQRVLGPATVMGSTVDYPPGGVGTGEDWVAVGDTAAMRCAGQAAQLEQWVALIEGRAHGLPGYAEAPAVQQTIEALLASR
jgi:hypothetical protein